MLTKRVSLIAAFLFGLAFFLWAENSFSPAFQKCINYGTLQKAADNSDNKRFIVAHLVGQQTICSIRLIDRHNGFFAALAACIVGFFTFALWRSTDKLWSAGRDTLETTERAFVYLDGFNIELTTAADGQATDIEHLPERYRSDPGLCITRFAVLPRWKNSGNTPTRKMAIQINWRGPPGPIPPDYIYRNQPEPFFLAPKAVESSGLIEMPGVQVLIDWAMRPIGVEPLVFIWGRADYEDIFKREHFIEWCRQLRFDRHDGKTLRASFIQWGDYNRTDETQ